MKNPSICPCTSKIPKEKYFFFIIILDICLGSFSKVLALIGLCMYCNPKNFRHKYFKIYSLIRFIIQILLCILMIVLLICYFTLDLEKIDLEYDMKMGLNKFPFDNKYVVITLFIICEFLIFWNIYLSYEFFWSIREYQNEEVNGYNALGDRNEINMI